MSKATVYEVVTDRIVKMLEAGTAPWRRTWAASAAHGRGAWPKNLASGKHYRGTNAFVLGVCSPFSSRYWLTFNQARAAGGNVRKGEKSTPVVFFRKVDKSESDDGRGYAVARYYSVFNLEQCDNIADPDGAGRPSTQPERIAACEHVLAGYTGPAFPTVRHGGDQPCYVPVADVVRMPHREQFDAPEHYYATLFHELAHSTGHDSRLRRPGIVDHASFADHAYSEEELVAELGAAFMCAHTGISPKTEGHSAAYVAHWLRVLKDDRKLFVRAASAAQKAADLVLGESREDAPEAEEAA